MLVRSGAAYVWLVLVLLAGSTVLSIPVAAGAQGGAGSSPALSSTAAAVAEWNVTTLTSAPIATVADDEPGVGVPDAVNDGTATVVSTLILVTFPLTQAAGLAQFLTALSNPNSPDYHHYLTAAEFDAQYGGATGPYLSAVDYFQSFGVTHLTTSADRLAVTFQATPEQVAAIFHVTLREYTAQGRTYFAPTGLPELPNLLASSVLSVEGLSNYSSYALSTASAASELETPTGDSPPVSAASAYLTPVEYDGGQYEYAPDLQVAYDEQSLFAQYGYPVDETVATILWEGEYEGGGGAFCSSLTSGESLGPYVPSDITDFYNETMPAGEPHAQAHAVPIDGAPEPSRLASCDSTDAAFENTLDLEMVGSLAPGASIYNVYGSNTDADLDAAFSYILNPTDTPGLQNVSVISNSWGSTDTNSSAWFQDLEEAQARGIMVLACSGDSGDDPATTWLVGDSFFPASMSYATFGDVAVGGSTVVLNSDSASPEFLHVTGDAAWYDASIHWGSSGGISAVFPEPSWQLDTSANAVIDGAGRGVPDIAAIANNTLVTISFDGYEYKASNASSTGSWYYAYGTSIATPVEAGVVAEIDHVLNATGSGPLGFLSPDLYALANSEFGPLASTETTGYDPTGDYTSPLPTLPLMDITTGGNYAYRALAGYDLVTGWGSIDAYNYTMYFVHVDSTGIAGRVSGVQDNLTLDGLSVYSTGSEAEFNASIQQNFFIANSLGAPIYWVQNVIYIVWQDDQWSMDYTGWVIFPFYGLYPSLADYEYNAPNRQYVALPKTFDVTTTLEFPSGFNTQYVAFSVGTQTVDLPVPGASYIIGSLYYNYSWQGTTYSNGPYPGNPVPGGLDPEFGLVGGPSGGVGYFSSPTSGSLTATLLPYGASTFYPATTKAFGENITQTGESAHNLVWTQQSGDQWSLGVQSGSTMQGVASYEPTTAPELYSVTLNESGLAAGTSWSATLAGVTHTSTTHSITFAETNGTYAFAVQNVSGYNLTPEDGSLSVEGGPQTESVEFTPYWLLVVNETGLPGTLDWEFSVDEYNGTTRVGTASAGPGPGISHAIFFGSNITELVVDGRSVSCASASTPGCYPGNVNWYPNSSLVLAPSDDAFAAGVEWTTLTYVEYFPLTFSELGLPGGWEWFQNFTERGAPYTFNSTESNVTYWLSNGSYSYAVSAAGATYSAESDHGAIVVDGEASPDLIRITFELGAPVVTFTESGLPAGTTWSVTVDGATYSSTSGSIGFPQPNGVYSYRVSDVPGWHQDTLPYSGTLVVNGTAVLEPNLAFLEVTYSVTFRGTGLPAGTNWTVVIHGTSHSATGPGTIGADLPNGTFAYAIGDVQGWHQTTIPYTGTGTVSGEAQTIGLTFEQVLYAVTFIESGLAAGTPWQVNTSGGQAHSSILATLGVSEPNGTYAFTVWTAANYSATPSDLSLSVNGAGNEAAVTFVRTYGLTFYRPSDTPAGAAWTVYLNGTSPPDRSAGAVVSSSSTVRTTTAASLTIMAANGTYSYTVTVSGSPALTTQGTTSVDGSNVVVTPSPGPAPSPAPGGLAGYDLLVGIIVIVALGAGLSVVLIRRKARK